MKALLTKVGLPKAIGLYVGDQEIAVSRVAYTPLGPVEVARHTESYEAEQLDTALDRVLTSLLGSKKRSRSSLAVGLPGLKVFFSTRPIQTKHSDPSPQVLLREALQSPTASADGMVVDLIKGQPGRRRVASIAACQRSYLANLLSSLERCRVRPLRVEPGPCALLRAAGHRHPAPRKAKGVLRIFLGESQGLGVLAAGNLPLLWRSFELPRGDEASAIVSVARALQTLSKYCGLDSPLDAVMIHGRQDLRGLLEFDWVQEQIGATTEWLEGGGLSSSELAFGLALGCLNSGGSAFDLSRSLKSRVCLREIFPWGEAALQASVLFCTGLFLSYQLGGLSRSYETKRAENARYAWMASAEVPQLEKEKRDLQQRVTAIRKFLSSRILWSSYTRDIPARLPGNAFLTALHGNCELEAAGKEPNTGAKPKKSLVLRGAAETPPDRSMPHEIDSLLDSLREHPLLKRDFPLVELADLKQVQPGGGSNSLAFFTVVCLPAANKSSQNGSDSKPESGSQVGEN